MFKVEIKFRTFWFVENNWMKICFTLLLPAWKCFEVIDLFHLGFLYSWRFLNLILPGNGKSFFFLVSSTRAATSAFPPLKKIRWMKERETRHWNGLKLYMYTRFKKGKKKHKEQKTFNCFLIFFVTPVTLNSGTSGYKRWMNEYSTLGYVTWRA